MLGRQATGQSAAARIGAHRFDNGAAMCRRATQVQQFPLFSSISSADCREIVSTAREKAFVRRQTIFVEGAPIRQILVLTSGCVKTTQLGQNGTEVILRLDGLGEVIGSFGGCSPVNHCSTARAIQASTALVWEAPVFEAVTERFPILRRNAVLILGNRLLELEERFREISTEKVAPRLGKEIVRLLNQVGRRVNGGVEISISRQELAQLTGTTPYTVSRVLSDWGQRGIVSSRRGAVIVCNLQALAQQLVPCEMS